MPIYPLLTAKFPMLTCSEIDKVIRDFVWGSSEGDRHMHLINWEDICKPKNKEGLRLRKATDMNKILLMKLGWRLLNNLDAL